MGTAGAYMGTPRLLDRFITAAEAFDKDFYGILLAENLLEQGGGGFGEGELAEAGIHGNGVGAGDLVEGIVLHFSSFHAARRFVCWFMLRVEPFVLLWLHCKHSSGAGSRRFRRFFCIFIW